MKTLLLAILLASCLAGAVELRPATISGQPGFCLDNGPFQLDLLPGSDGRIAAMRYQGPDGLSRNLIMPYIEHRDARDPLLPETVSGNNGGNKDWIWGQKYLLGQNFAMATSTGPNSREVIMSTPFFQGTPLAYQRMLTARDGEHRIILRARLRNQDERPRTFQLWSNNIPVLAGPEHDFLIIPTANGYRHLPQKTVSNSGKIPLARPWVARAAASLAMLFVTAAAPETMEPDGLLFYWIDGKHTTLTQELVSGSRTLPPGAETEFHFEYLMFPGLDDLHALTADGRAVQFLRQEQALLLGAVAPLPEAEWTLTVLTPAGDRRQLGRVSVPAQSAAVPLRLALPALPAPGESLEARQGDAILFLTLPL